MHSNNLAIFIFLLASLLFLASDKPNESNLPVGNWHSSRVAGRWQERPCEDTSLRLIMKISGDSMGEYFYHRGGDALYHSWGKCKIDTFSGVRCISFFNLKTKYRSMNDTFDFNDRHYPLLKCSQDTMVIRFNMCCNVDTCMPTSGWVTLVKQ